MLMPSTPESRRDRPDAHEHVVKRAIPRLRVRPSVQGVTGIDGACLDPVRASSAREERGLRCQTVSAVRAPQEGTV